MMSSNDPLKPVPGAELSPEPAKSPDSPECPDPIPLSEASPLKAGKKKKMPEVVDELKRQNARLTEENAKVEAGIDDLNLKFAAAGVRLWGQLVKLRNDVATGTLKLIAKLDGPSKPGKAPTDASASAPVPAPAPAYEAAPTATAPTTAPAVATPPAQPAAEEAAAAPIEAPMEEVATEDAAAEEEEETGTGNGEASAAEEATETSADDAN
eukprot:m.34565 g.34565  ORF g.34565 m.34565 type:complete len:211 (-) comp7332_c0_seq1:147-779(-)